MTSGSSDMDFATKTQAVLKTHGDVMLKIAHDSIVHGFEHGTPLRLALNTLAPDMAEHGACFVTLQKAGRLRGCIGSPEAHQPLANDIAQNAFSAAFRDPRFPALSPDETPGLHIHMSILSPPHLMTFADEQDFLGQLRPGEDGLIIEDKRQRALFLPSVWSQLPEPNDFVRQLKLKARLPADHWSDSFTARRFIAAETEADWAELAS